MFQGFTGWHALILLVIIVLLFGATKLPGLAKSVGQSMKIFKNEVKTEEAAKPVDGAQPNQTSPEAQQQTTDATKSDSKP
jgi:sec-independent protein translocase protein TatA